VQPQHEQQTTEAAIELNAINKAGAEQYKNFTLAGDERRADGLPWYPLLCTTYSAAGSYTTVDNHILLSMHQCLC
jgi:hypothetical protein